jgi:hypothetical protein
MMSGAVRFLSVVTILLILPLTSLTTLTRTASSRFSIQATDSLSSTSIADGFAPALRNWVQAFARPDAGTYERVQHALGQVPLFFEPNIGQFSSSAEFAACFGHNRLWIDATGITFSFPSKGISSLSDDQKDSVKGPARMTFVDANRFSTMRGENPLEGRLNYFFGNDPSKWHSGVPTYGSIVAESVYPGVDLTCYGIRDHLEYDFVVAAGVDPSAIRMKFDGFQQESVDSSGALILRGAGQEVRQDRPVAYQIRDGSRTVVDAAFSLSPEGTASFKLGDYDPLLELVIDPVLTYSTYLGGIDADLGRAIFVNQTGAAYICGDSRSSDFTHGTPTNSDVFIGQVTPNGGVFTYSFFGGSGDDTATGLAVDAAGNLYVSGTTRSVDYPKVNSINGGVSGESDAFITKLNPSGEEFLYSTVFGGSGAESAVSLALDGGGNTYVAGKTTSADFPAVNAFQPAFGGGDSDAFIAKILPDGSNFVYSSYLGGSENEIGLDRTSIVLDTDENLYLTGDTRSADFPTKDPLQAAKNGNSSTTDAFVSVINAAGSDLVFSSYLGGAEDDSGLGIAIDTTKSVYIAGKTNSTSFTGSNVTRPAANGSDAFVAKLVPDGSTYSYLTFFGGSGDEVANAIAVDSDGSAAITGSAGAGLVTLNAIQTYFTGNRDVFVARLGPTGAVNFSTYLGGSEDDSGLGVAVQGGSIYVTGFTGSIDYPTSNVVRRQNAGLTDVFVSKVDPDLTQKKPVILKVIKNGNELSVFGQNFKSGSVIMVNEKPKSTHSGIDPNQILISNKGAKKIRPGRTVQIQVQNPNGKLSNFFFFTGPPA